MTLPLEARLLRKILINNGSAPTTDCSPYCTPDSHQKRRVTKKRRREEKKEKKKEKIKQEHKAKQTNKQKYKGAKEPIEAESGRRN